jgi:hypothetical protein
MGAARWMPPHFASAKWFPVHDIPLANPTFVVSSNSSYLFRFSNPLESVRSHSERRSPEIPFVLAIRACILVFSSADGLASEPQ